MECWFWHLHFIDCFCFVCLRREVSSRRGITTSHCYLGNCFNYSIPWLLLLQFFVTFKVVAFVLKFLQLSIKAACYTYLKTKLLRLQQVATFVRYHTSKLQRVEPQIALIIAQIHCFCPLPHCCSTYMPTFLLTIQLVLVCSPGRDCAILQLPLATGNSCA